MSRILYFDCFSGIAGDMTCATLPGGTRERASVGFERLEEAEAKVHGTTMEKVHFHEVGATDAIVDIVSACFLFEHLGAPGVFCSPLPGGSGGGGASPGTSPAPGPAPPGWWRPNRPPTRRATTACSRWRRTSTT